MLITSMIDHQIHHVFHLPCMQLSDQLVVVLHCSIAFVDVAVVRDVIAHVDLRRREDRAQPDSVGAEGLDVREARGNAADGASGTIGRMRLEGRRVDLIDAGFFPPGAVNPRRRLRLIPWRHDC